MTTRQTTMFFLLGASWGASFLFVRVAVPALGPVVVADARVLMAAAALIGYKCLIQGMPKFTKPLRSYLILGFFNAAAQFGLMAFADQRLGASLTAINIATMPLWSAPIAAVCFHDKLPQKALFGLVLGVAGVVLVVGVAHAQVDATHILATGAALLSALSGAIGGNYARSAFGGESAMAQTIGQQLSAGIILLPLTVLVPPVQVPSLPQVLAMLALALWSSALAFLIYFRLIAEIGATKTLTVEFLVPVFAALWGWVFLAEQLSAAVIIGAGLILCGCALVNGWPLWRKPIVRGKTSY